VKTTWRLVPRSWPSACALLSALSVDWSAFPMFLLSANAVVTNVLLLLALVQCRAWIRKALNQNCLHYCFETLFSKTKQRVRGNYYETYAFARDDEATTALRQLLKPLESLPADFAVDDVVLDTVRVVEAEDAMISAKKVKSEAEVRWRAPPWHPCLVVIALCSAG
jgi:hypothetical protein